VDYFLTQLVNGLAMGSIYAMMAVGYSIIYGILELINFAHGDLCMVGVFVALSLLVVTGNPFIALTGACLTGAIVGIFVERFAYRPVRSASRAAPFVSAVGAALVLRNIAQSIWGTKTVHFPSLIPVSFITVGTVKIPGLSLTIFALAAATMLIVVILVNRTKVGLAVRCVSQNIPAARLMGMPVGRIITIVYAIGAAVGVLGGVLYATYYNSVFIGLGFQTTVKAFTASLLGGLGNMYGAFLGGILLGVMESFSAGFISSAFRDAIGYGILIIVLVLKPSGLLGMRVSEKA
jgi:branched-chain amino acid transport system permease protein